jgi:hypothetical protein
MAANKKPGRNEYDQRFSALDKGFYSWEAHYRELSNYIQPRNGRYNEYDVNKGDRRDQFILDSTATRAARTLSAGMMAGMTSPARPWFRLATDDPDLMEFQPVKSWVREVGELMRRIFAGSNTYRALHTMYDELGTFGTGFSLLLSDFDDVVRHYTQTVGEYRLAQSSRGTIDTVYRDFPMTVSQVVQQFGKQNLSIALKNMYDTGNLDAVVRIRHCIEPRYDRDYGKRDKLNMPFKSVYYEKGAEDGKILREGGYEEFPGLSPRWSVIGNDTYGRSPGMDALGDVMQLQHDNEIWAKGTEYQADPPVQLPSSMKGHQHDLLPGGESYYNDLGGVRGGIRTAFEVNLDLSALQAGIQDKRQQINSTYYADLFTMLSTMDRRQMTATEVAERHEEKLLVLGPVLERLHNEMLDPLIDRTFAMIVRAGLLPPPPQELQGSDIKVEYVSMLAQAQRAVGVTAVDRLLGTVGSVAQFKPDVLDKLDADQMVDEYAEMLGVSPDLIIGDDQVAIIRTSRQQAQAQQAQLEAIPAAAQAAKTLSETSLEGDTALTQQFSGL